MTTKTMRVVDRFIGIPLCWLLGSLIHLTSHTIHKKSTDTVKNILVIKFFGLGSILLSSSALSLIRQSFSQARISFLTFSGNRELLARMPVVDDIIVIDPSSLGRFLRDTLKTLRRIKAAGFDVVFDFEFFSKFSTLLSAISGARYRVGFSLPTIWRSLLVTHQVDLVKNRHVRDAFCDQVFTLSPKRSIPPMMSPAIRDEDCRSLESLMPHKDHPIVCINVNAGDTFIQRRWPGERFAELVDRMSVAHPDAEFFFVGIETERGYVQSVINRVTHKARCHNFAGTLSMGSLLALLHRADLVVSNDSGPLHLAASLGSRCIGLYGPESPDFYGPEGNHVRVLYRGIPCSPCMNVYDAKTFVCPYDALCMREIEVDEVLRCVEESHFHLEECEASR